MGKQWKQWDFILGGSKIAADGDCSRGIKRLFFLGKKAITNLDNILKGSDIILPTKVCLVKAMFFPSSHVWIWELDYKESWVSKNWCFWTVVLKKTLEHPLDCKEIKPANPKGNQSWIFIRRTDGWSWNSNIWPTDVKNWLIGKDPDAGKDWRQEEKGDNRGWDGHEFEQAPGVGDGQKSLACCSLWGCRVRHDWVNWTDCLLITYQVLGSLLIFL